MVQIDAVFLRKYPPFTVFKEDLEGFCLGLFFFFAFVSVKTTQKLPFIFDWLGKNSVLPTQWQKSLHLSCTLCTV